MGEVGHERCDAMQYAMRWSRRSVHWSTIPPLPQPMHTSATQHQQSNCTPFAVHTRSHTHTRHINLQVGSGALDLQDLDFKDENSTWGDELSTLTFTIPKWGV